jgi:hypothetical protein
MEQWYIKKMNEVRNFQAAIEVGGGEANIFDRWQDLLEIFGGGLLAEIID